MSITNSYIKLGVSNNKSIKIKYENHSTTYKKAQLTIAKKSYELSEFILKKIINKEFSKTETYIFSLKIDTIYIYSSCMFDTKNGNSFNDLLNVIYKLNTDITLLIFCVDDNDNKYTILNITDKEFKKILTRATKIKEPSLKKNNKSGNKIQTHLTQHKNNTSKDNSKKDTCVNNEINNKDDNKTKGICKEEDVNDTDADIDDDDTVAVLDLLMLLEHWGECDLCEADIEGSGLVDAIDLQLLLDAWLGL